MQTFKELGISIIKCENKQGNDKIKEIHYRINELLFKYQMRYAMWGLASFLEKKLTEFGIELAAVETTEAARAKKNEILTILRKYVRVLKQYTDVNGIDATEENKAATAIQKYSVSNYLKNKETLSTEQIITILEDNKELYDNAIKNYIIPSFKKMNDELIEMFKKRYAI